jgi:hypothetical protein
MDDTNPQRSGEPEFNPLSSATRQGGETMCAERPELSDFRLLARLRGALNDASPTIRKSLALIKESNDLLTRIDQTLGQRIPRWVDGPISLDQENGTAEQSVVPVSEAEEYGHLQSAAASGDNPRLLQTTIEAWLDSAAKESTCTAQ